MHQTASLPALLPRESIAAATAAAQPNRIVYAVRTPVRPRALSGSQVTARAACASLGKLVPRVRRRFTSSRSANTRGTERRTGTGCPGLPLLYSINSMRILMQTLSPLAKSRLACGLHPLSGIAPRAHCQPVHSDPLCSAQFWDLSVTHESRLEIAHAAGLPPWMSLPAARRNTGKLPPVRPGLRFTALGQPSLRTRLASQHAGRWAKPSCAISPSQGSHHQ
jgi:hypothetical protein